MKTRTRLSPSRKGRLKALLCEAAGPDKRLGHDRLAEVAAKTGTPLRDIERFALDAGMIPKRYDRNIGTLGLEGQARLLGSRVLVVGLGGLGGHVVESLARLGVGRIVGVDGDRFDETNLNRQIYCEMTNLGRKKAEASRALVAHVNPAVEFIPHAAAFESLGSRIFKGCAAVFDCLDSIPSRLALSKLCAEARVPLVHGAIAGWSGEVGVCLPGGGTIEKLYQGATGPRGIEKELGNLPMTAAVAANMMVAAAVPILLGRRPARSLRFFDLSEGSS
ncbi:MAG: ThiF family adenylyltransferase [Elusimicrobia bacterium]|nr:ThiF family adenylyltransferase [Elusimicrobiota bacterium]